MSVDTPLAVPLVCQCVDDLGPHVHVPDVHVSLALVSMSLHSVPRLPSWSWSLTGLYMVLRETPLVADNFLALRTRVLHVFQT